MIIGTAIAAFILGMAFTLVVFVLNGNPLADQLATQLKNSHEKERKAEDQLNRANQQYERLLEQVESRALFEVGVKTDIKLLNDRLEHHEKNCAELSAENDSKHCSLLEEQQKVATALCQIGNLESELRTKEQSLASSNRQLEEQRALVVELRESIKAKSGKIEELESVVEKDRRKLNEIQRTLHGHTGKE